MSHAPNPVYFRLTEPHVRDLMTDHIIDRVNHLERCSFRGKASPCRGSDLCRSISNAHDGRCSQDEITSPKFSCAPISKLGTASKSNLGSGYGIWNSASK